ncbi:MAG: ThuA domain-containing protein, partial [Blastocatellia bacterium]
MKITSSHIKRSSIFYLRSSILDPLGVTMKAWSQIIIIAFAATCALPPFTPPAQPQVRALVFSKTTGFRHDSIPDGIAAIRQLGLQNNFDVDATEDASLFTDTNLARYQTVVFLNTTGDALNDDQQAAFQRYIRNGGGFVGVHSATDTEYDWAWYGGLVGAYFQSHPAIQPAQIRIEDSSHPSTSTLPVEWRRTDEWYNFRSNPRGRVKTLATLDEATYSGGAMGADHPIAWCQLYDGGRSWYTAGGHTKESYAEPLFRQHLLGGVQFTAKIKDGACAALTGASAASFRTDSVASESIASIFGSAMATTTQSAMATPLPTTLVNTSVRVRDGAGNESLAPLFFVSPTQINLLIPAGAANGASIFT